MENNNSVCYVGKVTEIKAIEGADNIELGVVGGWNAINKKGEYKVGDLVVIATTDAVIPQELSDAMGVTSYLRKGQRVRTVKLRGVYSECLILPFSIAPMMRLPIEGEDMMEVLGIFKYEPPAVQVQLASGRKIKYHQNPNFGVYYKFPNLKNVAGMFTEDDLVEITRKIHGTNARYGIVKKKKISIWDKVKRFFGNEWVE
jgi:RNA ligase (TIGR02306 family)